MRVGFERELPFDQDVVRQITLVGVGLIGGSLGLALKERRFNGPIVGLGRRALDDALARGAIDRYTQSPAEAAREADLIILCTPVERIPAMVAQLAPFLKEGCIVTDVGSVKQLLVSEVDAQIPAGCSFVGAHPMAGSEQRGVAFARSDLFEGAICLVTPTERTSAAALETVIALWQSLGAQVVQMSPAEHDYLIGAASHLPHLVAAALTQTVTKAENEAGRALDFAATGFRDTTRIAAGSPGLWKHILVQNREVVLHAVEELIENLRHYHQALSHADVEELGMLLRQAQRVRKSMNR